MNKAAVGGVGVLVLLGGGYLGATAWSGQQAEARFRAQGKEMQARLPFVRIGERTYEKGFFTSMATATLQFGCPAAGGQPLPVARVTSTIRHGPLAGSTLAAAVVESQLHVSGGGAEAQQLLAAFGPAGPLSVRTVVGFDGRSHSTFASPAARLTAGPGATLAWQGMDGEVEASGDGRSVRYRARSPGFTIADPARQLSVRVGANAVEGDGRAITPGGPFLAGRMQGTLAVVEMLGSTPGGEPVKVAFDALAFQSTTTLVGEMLGGSTSFSGKGAVGDVKLDKVDMKMSLKRLHAPTYQRLMETLTREAYRCDSVNPAAALAGLQEKMQGDLATLLRHGPEISLDRLAIESGGLSGEISYAAGVDAMSEAQAAQPLPALILSQGHARASVRVPTAWIRALSQAGASRLQGGGTSGPAPADAMLDLAEAKGYVVREGDMVKSDASYVKGVVTVNGKPVAVR